MEKRRKSPEPMAKAPWAVTRVPKVRLPDNLAVLPWPIPEELIEEILTYLPPITVLCNLRSASRTWRRFIDQQCNAWRNAYFGLLHRFVQAHRKDNHLTFWRFASLETIGAAYPQPDEKGDKLEPFRHAVIETDTVRIGSNLQKRGTPRLPAWKWVRLDNGTDIKNSPRGLHDPIGENILARLQHRLKIEDHCAACDDFGLWRTDWQNPFHGPWNPLLRFAQWHPCTICGLSPWQFWRAATATLAMSLTAATLRIFTGQLEDKRQLVIQYTHKEFEQAQANINVTDLLVMGSGHKSAKYESATLTDVCVRFYVQAPCGSWDYDSTDCDYRGRRKEDPVGSGHYVHMEHACTKGRDFRHGRVTLNERPWIHSCISNRCMGSNQDMKLIRNLTQLYTTPRGSLTLPLEEFLGQHLARLAERAVPIVVPRTYASQMLFDLEAKTDDLCKLQTDTTPALRPLLQNATAIRDMAEDTVAAQISLSKARHLAVPSKETERKMKQARKRLEEQTAKLETALSVISESVQVLTGKPPQPTLGKRKRDPEDEMELQAKRKVSETRQFYRELYETSDME